MSRRIEEHPGIGRAVRADKKTFRRRSPYSPALDHFESVPYSRSLIERAWSGGRRRTPFITPRHKRKGGAGQALQIQMTNVDEIRYRILKALDGNPEISQRDLSKELGVSLGKTNYCLRALVDRGWVKVRNFQKSDNKRAYAYFLTPKGLTEKTEITLRFLKYKLNEFEHIEKEIEQLRREAAKGDGGSSGEAKKS